MQRCPLATEQSEADVLIIGAGPSGAVTAKRLAEAGLEIVCLEQGDWPDYTRALAGQPEFEITANKYWNWDPNVRAAPSDYPVDDADSDVTALMYNGVGGGTVIYAAHWERFLPSDFRVRSVDGIADDWPLDYFELEQHYQAVEREFAVSGLEGNPALPPGMGPPLPPVPLNKIGRLGARALNELGWHWWPASNAIATVKYGALHPCQQRTSCLWGCPTEAKASVDRTHWKPLRSNHYIRLETGARVRRIVLGKSGLATGAEYVDRDGSVRFQPAKVTILCANGLGTPRLLFLSATEGHEHGLANSSGLVGKRLMMHPFGTVIGLFEEDLEGWRGPWGQYLHSLEFYETDESRGFVRGAKWGLMPTGAPLSMMLPGLWGDRDVWGERFHEALRSRLGRSAMWGVICEDLPEESNRVVLAEDRCDSDGISGVKVFYKNSENSHRMMAFHLEHARLALEQMGAYETVTTANIRVSGWHLLGTARMGEKPDESVVDPYGRTHDIPNLYIFDGSVFPTSSGVNPTATIAALAHRFSEHLVSQARDQRIPELARRVAL